MNQCCECGAYAEDLEVFFSYSENDLWRVCAECMAYLDDDWHEDESIEQDLLRSFDDEPPDPEIDPHDGMGWTIDDTSER